MFFAMPEQSRYDIEHELGSVYIDKHGGHFMQWIIFDQLNSHLHYFNYIIIRLQSMSIDRRYDALVTDLLTLFQELTLRYLKQKTIDIEKFRHYFNLFYDRMQQLEGSFHESKLKITHLVARLRQTFSSDTLENNKNQAIIAKTSVLRNKQTSSEFSKSFNRSVSSKKQSDISKKLGSIVQQDEYPASRVINKRSQTAAGYRSFSLNEERIPVRPKTGQVSAKRSNFDRQKLSKTININQQILETSQQRYTIDQHPYVLDSQQILNKRRKFYQELQKQKDKDNQSQPLSNQQMKWIFKRKKTKNGWGKKINRLF